jgi:hypothetical protein
MRTRTARFVHALGVLALCTTATAAVAGCGTRAGTGTGTGTGGTKAGGHGPAAHATTSAPASPAAQARARQVADAWNGSKAAEAWGKGYYPMGAAIQLPAGGLHDDNDKLAYGNRAFVLRGMFPATSPTVGQVRWKSGGMLTLPMANARKAYEALARNSSRGPHLTVTGAKPGTMTLATSRGPATVPAWLFTLAGYTTPLKQAAVSPSKLPRPPIRPSERRATGGVSALRLVRVAADGRSVTVRATHGACDDGAAVNVLEQGGSVVLMASVVGEKRGPCPAYLASVEVTVKLHRPLGDRILLDALTGEPVPYGTLYEHWPSWS